MIKNNKASLSKGIEIIKIPEVYPMFTLGYRDKINEFNSKLNKLANNAGPTTQSPSGRTGPVP